MSWLTSLPSGHVMQVQEYFDQRTDPADEDAVQVQRHQVVVTEYRGVTYAVALAAVNNKAVVYANGYESWSMQHTGGGGYTVTKTLDYTLGDWTSTKYTAGG